MTLIYGLTGYSRCENITNCNHLCADNLHIVTLGLFQLCQCRHNNKRLFLVRVLVFFVKLLLLTILSFSSH